MKDPKIVKVSFSLSEDELKILKDIAEEQGSTVTEVVRHAVQLEKFVSDVKRRQELLLVKKNNGQINQVVF